MWTSVASSSSYGARGLARSWQRRRGAQRPVQAAAAVPSGSSRHGAGGGASSSPSQCSSVLSCCLYVCKGPTNVVASSPTAAVAVQRQSREPSNVQPPHNSSPSLNQNFSQFSFKLNVAGFVIERTGKTPSGPGYSSNVVETSKQKQRLTQKLRKEKLRKKKKKTREMISRSTVTAAISRNFSISQLSFQRHSRDVPKIQVWT